MNSVADPHMNAVPGGRTNLQRLIVALGDSIYNEYANTSLPKSKLFPEPSWDVLHEEVYPEAMRQYRITRNESLAAGKPLSIEDQRFRREISRRISERHGG
jgi:hypothetical protein